MFLKPQNGKKSFGTIHVHYVRVLNLCVDLSYPLRCLCHSELSPPPLPAVVSPQTPQYSRAESVPLNYISADSVPPPPLRSERKICSDL